MVSERSSWVIDRGQSDLHYSLQEKLLDCWSGWTRATDGLLTAKFKNRQQPVVAGQMTGPVRAGAAAHGQLQPIRALHHWDWPIRSLETSDSERWRSHCACAALRDGIVCFLASDWSIKMLSGLLLVKEINDGKIASLSCTSSMIRNVKELNLSCPKFIFNEPSSLRKLLIKMIFVKFIHKLSRSNLHIYIIKVKNFRPSIKNFVLSLGKLTIWYVWVNFVLAIKQAH